MSSVPEQIIERLKELRDQIRYYGLYLGAALILVELVQFWQHNSISIGGAVFLFFFKIAVLFATCYWIIQQIKPAFFKRGMSYLQSFSLIMRLFLYATLFLGIFSFILYRWLAPNYLTEVLENSIKTIQSYMDAAQLPSAQETYIENLIEDLEDAPVPSAISAMWAQMWAYITWGIFVSLILSLFTRDKNINPFTATEDNNES